MDSVILDSIHCDILIPAHVAAKLKKRAAERGVSLSHYINVMLFAHTHEDPWTDADEKERRKIIFENNQHIKNKKTPNHSKKKGNK